MKKAYLFAPMPTALLLDSKAQRAAETRTTEFPVEPAGLWASIGLQRDGGAILETDLKTWHVTRKTLLQQGLDPDDLCERGRLIVLDTHKVHTEITADGSLCPPVLEDIIAKAAESVRETTDGPIHVWTDTVAVLQEQLGPWVARFARTIWEQAANRHDLRLIAQGTPDLDEAQILDGANGWSEYVTVQATPGDLPRVFKENDTSVP